jgi:hypothetical protein
MAACDWIVCERGNRWAAGLRVAVARQFPIGLQAPRLCEVRRLAELTERLDTRPNGFGLVEVHPSNFAAVLAWLSEAACHYPDGCCAALVDVPSVESGEYEPWLDRDERNEVTSALLEAGAVAVTDSPRHLQHVLTIGQQHCEHVAALTSSTATSPGLEEWARGLVPWQDA